ncbi:MAG: hypothetical protein IJL26_05520 [Clostridia bacterium]|nr:hypothetical protein [Clostridia bacterium]
MKNKEMLIDAIGDADDALIPALTEKKKKKNKSIAKRIVAVAACAALLIGGGVLLPRLGGKPGVTQNGNDPTGVPQGILPIAAAVYPELPQYPEERNYSDWEDYEPVYNKWRDATQRLRNQPKGYQNGFDAFFTATAETFLRGEGTENRVYSPLSLYMALALSAEVTDGNSRRQILDLLSQEDIETLRARARSVWLANYMDDGMAKCVLATSLWLNDSVGYNKKTVETAAENYYSSVFSGDPASSEYSETLRSWLNEQTDGLLEDYVSGIKMDPLSVLTLASTVNYSGRWREKFDQTATEEAAFHAPGGDVRRDFMKAERLMGYDWGDHFAAIELTLENNGRMRLILPDEGYSPADLLKEDQVLDYLTQSGSWKNNKYTLVRMSVPKFDVSSQTDLRDGLQSLGVTDIFDPEKSDFSPLTDDTDGIFLGKAEQDARVLIDEDGCKAAAMTVMMYCGAGMPEDEVDFILDRPFLFEIMSETGLPLFVGVVNDPAA